MGCVDVHVECIPDAVSGMVWKRVGMILLKLASHS